MEKSKSKFSAFPARDELQQQQDKNSEPKRVLEPVLPTVRQPEKAFYEPYGKANTALKELRFF